MARRKLVLVVEDDEREREIYGKLLWYNGFDVAFAHDGEQGLELARQDLPDLVLLDLILPGIDGLRFCEGFRQIQGGMDTPVLVLSGRPKAEFGPRVLRAGCVDYVEKPAPPLEVLHRIERLIGRPPLPGEIADDAPDERGGGRWQEARDHRALGERKRDIGALREPARQIAHEPGRVAEDARRGPPRR